LTKGGIYMNQTLLKIRELMDERGWTIYRLAKESDIPYSSLNSMFLKNNQPTLSTLEKICDGFCITLCEFFSDDTPHRIPVDIYTDDEKHLINQYKRLSKYHKKLLAGFIELLENN